jgi:ParB family chromosome partitioning protein
MPKKVLGRGLEALIPQTVSENVAGENVFHVPVNTIEANPFQPRKVFNKEHLAELSESINHDGVLQPVVVRRKGNKYELIMGERRLQATRLAGKATIPVIVKDASDADSLRLALVENIQRENLNAIEVALAYKQLVAAFNLSQQELAKLVGRDRSSVANTIRLLNLPDEVQNMIGEGKIAEGHARALLTLPTQTEQLSMARKIVENQLSVRQVEMETGLTKKAAKTPKAAKEKPAYLKDLEDSMSTHLGTRVLIEEKRGGKGKMVIEFYSHEDFERLTEALNIPLPR